MLREIIIFYKRLNKVGANNFKHLIIKNQFIQFLNSLKEKEIQRLFENLFDVSGKENQDRKNLLKILKIDYFLSQINDLHSNYNSLSNIIFLAINDINPINLTVYYLPFKENNEKLISYGEFLRKILESKAYVSSMQILMNLQSKDKNFSLDEIKFYLEEVLEDLLNPIIFKNENENSHLYAITCINFKVYLSSFMFTNIQQDVENVGDTSYTVDDQEKINELRNDILSNVDVGFDFCSPILTILHESCHVLRRRIIQPSVYINTEELQLESLKSTIDTNGKIKFKFEASDLELLFSLGDQKICESGEMLEYLLFGNLLSNFVIEEIQYIMNLLNWSNDLKTFRSNYANIRMNTEKPYRVSKKFMSRSNNFREEGYCGNKRNLI